MASGQYNRAKAAWYKGRNWQDAGGLVFKIMPVGSGYTFDPDHDFVSDVNPGANEIVATGYAGGFSGAGRKALTGKTVITDDTNNRGMCDANDVVYSSLGVATPAPVALILYLEGTSDADSELVAYLDPPTDPAPNGGDWNIVWPVGGLFGH